MTSGKAAFVHLAYFDETGTDGHSPIAMFGALVVPVGKFGYLSALHSTAIQQILPIERIEEFKEFHASELYRGKEIFEGIDEQKRFTAIQVLLMAVRMERLHFIYSAIDRKQIANSPFASMGSLVPAFHMCLLGVEDWATANHVKPHPALKPDTKVLDWKDTYLCILDDCSDKALKAQLKQTYRSLRIKYPFIINSKNRLWHSHDDMFFSDSTDSLGIQIVDLCNYFVRMHLEGRAEPKAEEFYQMIAGQVICAKPEPEWGQYGHLFRTHGGEKDETQK